LPLARYIRDAEQQQKHPGNSETRDARCAIRVAEMSHKS
jgi:hypothetical protein